MSFLVVIEPGARSLVQDTGFRGGRDVGVPRAGVLDRDALTLLNGLLGNPAGTAALEVAVTSPRLMVEGGALRIACGAGLTGNVLRAGATIPLPEWTAMTLRPGDELRLNPPARGGTALLGVAGGFDLPRIFGSQSTLLTAGFGGLDGRALRAGDRLPVPETAGAEAAPMRLAPAPEAANPGGPDPIRVVPGPQAEWFTEAAMTRFLAEAWHVSPALDRMGMRLTGPALAHNSRLGADITSDGVVPGAIQVPGDGQPIVLLADAQTTGGYPKIATIISADLSRAARAVPGDLLRFCAVSVAEAEAAARQHAADLRRICAARSAAAPPLEAALLTSNLVSGGVDARRPDHFPGSLIRGRPGAAEEKETS